MAEFLNRGTRKLVESRMKKGGYPTPDDVVVAALASLEQQERFGDFADGELDKLLAEGKASGDLIDGVKALAERRRRREGGGFQSVPDPHELPDLPARGRRFGRDLDPHRTG